MKTQSIKSIAILVAAASMLSSTVFAGPGPKGAPQNASQPTKPAATIAVYPSAQSGKSTGSTARPPHLIYTAHGGVTVL